MHNLMSFYFSITTVGRINRPTAGLFIFRSTNICIIHLFVPKLVPKVTELAEVSLSTPSLRLKYARDPFKVWTSLLKLQYWFRQRVKRGWMRPYTGCLFSRGSYKDCVFQSQQLQTVVLLLSGSAPWWCNFMLVLSHEEMFHFRSVMCGHIYIYTYILM